MKVEICLGHICPYLKFLLSCVVLDVSVSFFKKNNKYVAA